MVNQDPLFKQWTWRKFNSTIINDIWSEVLLFTGISTMVYAVSTFTSHSLAVSNSLINVLGTVLGLVISFRTSSAYERYQEGRKLWVNIAVASRGLAQLIWIHVPNERTGPISQTVLQSIIEKKTMINLIHAYSVSLKHFLRGETGIYYTDLYPLICYLPRYVDSAPGAHSIDDMLPLWRASEDEHMQGPSAGSNRNHPLVLHPDEITSHQSMARTSSTAGQHTRGVTTDTMVAEPSSEKDWLQSLKARRHRQATGHADFDPEKVLPIVNSHRELLPARNPPTTSFLDYFPFLRLFRYLGKIFRHDAKDIIDDKPKSKAGARGTFGRKKKTEIVESNVPLEITLFLSSYSAFLIRNGLLQPALASSLTNTLVTLQDTTSNLERIANTPIPFAYQVHLRMSLWLYLFFLPFQLFSMMQYLTIPATAFAAFLLLGFLEIGQEIENPFNYDLNDIDLDHLCLTIQRELNEITAHVSPQPSDFVFSPWNQPFAPTDRRTAEDLTQDVPTNHKVGDTAEAPPQSQMSSIQIQRTMLKNWSDVDRLTRS